MGQLLRTGRRWWGHGSVLTRAWAVCVAAAAAGAALLVGSSALAVTGNGTVDGAAPPSAAAAAPGGMAPGGMAPGGTAPGAGATNSAGNMFGTDGGSPGGTAMAPMAGMGGASAGGTPAASGICPNVKGATVMADGMVMAPVPSGSPTAAEQAAADQLVAQVSSGIGKYTSLAAAEADGYASATGKQGPTTHYLNASVVRSGDVLDPSHPSSLVYANTVDGPVLIGAMFLGPAPCQPGPDVGGPLTQWHAHDNLCVAGGGRVVGRTDNGVCASGHKNPNTYFMLHVWTAPSIADKYQFQADLPRSAYTQVLRTGQP